MLSTKLRKMIKRGLQFVNIHAIFKLRLETILTVSEFIFFRRKKE